MSRGLPLSKCVPDVHVYQPRGHMKWCKYCSVDCRWCVRFKAANFFVEFCISNVSITFMAVHVTGVDVIKASQFWGVGTCDVISNCRPTLQAMPHFPPTHSPITTDRIISQLKFLPIETSNWGLGMFSSCFHGVWCFHGWVLTQPIVMKIKFL